MTANHWKTVVGGWEKMFENVYCTGANCDAYNKVSLNMCNYLALN